MALSSAAAFLPIHYWHRPGGGIVHAVGGVQSPGACKGAAAGPDVVGVIEADHATHLLRLNGWRLSVNAASAHSFIEGMPKAGDCSFDNIRSGIKGSLAEN